MKSLIRTGGLTLVLLLGLSITVWGEDIDFTPHPANKYDVEEYWLIKDGKIEEFVDYYRKTVYPYITRLDGYRGWTVKTPLPEKGSDGKFGWLELGPPRHIIPISSRHANGFNHPY